MRPSSEDCSTTAVATGQVRSAVRPPATTTTTYASLPPELWHEICGFLPEAVLQRTTAALLVALGRVGDALVDRSLLYRHLVVGRPGQLRPLVDELTGWDAVDDDDEAKPQEQEQRASSDEPLASFRRQHQEEDEERPSRHRRRRPPSRSLRLTAWHPSPALVLEALDRLPELTLLALNIGTPFAPEHVEQALDRPRPHLGQLELRFRPYVDRASYHQFLAGAYFDTALEALARWPPRAVTAASRAAGVGGSSDGLTRLSIVQDVAPRHLVDPSVVRGGSGGSSVKPVRAGPSLSTALSSLLPPSSSSSLASSSSTNGVQQGEGGEKVNDPLTAEARAERERVERRRLEEVRGRGRYTGHGPFPYLDGRLAGAQPKIFAQPIVFFALSCVTELACSPAAERVSHLRLRIPLRDVVPSLVGSVSAPRAGRPARRVAAAAAPSTTRTTTDETMGLLPSPSRKPFPNVSFLDLSTTNVRLDRGDLVALLEAFSPRLTTLVLDHTHLFGFLGAGSGAVDRGASARGVEGARELGRLVASQGVARAKAAERELAKEAERRWRASRARLSAATAAAAAAAPIDDADIHAEEEAEGQAASALADELARLTTEEYLPAGRGRRVNVRSMAHSTFSLRTDRPGGPILPRTPIEPYHPEIQPFVLPPLPSVRSIALGNGGSSGGGGGGSGGGGERGLDAVEREAWTEAFERGWIEGLGRVAEQALKVVGDRLERARRRHVTDRRALDRWLERQSQTAASAATTTAGSTPAAAAGARGATPRKVVDGKGKGKAGASASSLSSSTRSPAGGSTMPGSSSAGRPPAPTEVALYRYLTPEELDRLASTVPAGSVGPSTVLDQAAAAAGLVRVPLDAADDDGAADWRLTYLHLLTLTPATLDRRAAGGDGSNGGRRGCAGPKDFSPTSSSLPSTILDSTAVAGGGGGGGGGGHGCLFCLVPDEPAGGPLRRAPAPPTPQTAAGGHSGTSSAVVVGSAGGLLPSASGVTSAAGRPGGRAGGGGGGRMERRASSASSSSSLASSSSDHSIGSSAADDDDVDDSDVDEDADGDDLFDDPLDGPASSGVRRRRTPASWHVPGCGHLVGRTLWTSS